MFGYISLKICFSGAIQIKAFNHINPTRIGVRWGFELIPSYDFFRPFSILTIFDIIFSVF